MGIVASGEHSKFVFADGKEVDLSGMSVVQKTLDTYLQEFYVFRKQGTKRTLDTKEQEQEYKERREVAKEAIDEMHQLYDPDVDENT